MSAPVLLRKKAQTHYTLFAVCPGGIEPVLKQELTELNVLPKGEFPGGIEFEGSLEQAYRACLSLRTASRILLLLQQVNEVRSADALYKAVYELEWSNVFVPRSTFAVSVTESHSQKQNFAVNPQFLALKAKDAIADYFKKHTGKRPDVDRVDPDLMIRLHLHNHTLKIYLDLSGPSLHERGYRTQAGEAPLKENLAAGLLLMAGWNSTLTEGAHFYDPFCGSGTLMIEAAMIASKTAPGLLRKKFGFFAWRDHQKSTYEKIRASLTDQILPNSAEQFKIRGSDIDPKLLTVAAQNIKNAAFDSWITLEHTAFEQTKPQEPSGLIVCNPPYGVRMGDETSLLPLYATIGSTFKHQYKGWQAGVLSSNKKLLQAISLKPSQKKILRNGKLETFFYTYHLF